MKPKYVYYYRCQKCAKVVWVYDKERAKQPCPFCSEGPHEYMGCKIVKSADD